MQRFFFILFLIGCFSRNNSIGNERTTAVENVVKKMNFALADHNLEVLLESYSAEMDWENSFGWTIKNKGTLSIYFDDWLFKRYPKLGPQRLGLRFQTHFLTKETAWVDVLQQIKSENLDTVIRTYRQTHLLIKEGNDWLIKKTRLWAPTIHKDPPIEFISAPSFFE